MIIKILTMHLYVNSTREMSDSCGNCDGADCNNCRTMWEFDGERFITHEEALLAEAKSKSSWEELVPGVEVPSYPQFALNDNGELCALHWNEENGDHLIICNTEASAYDALYSNALKATELWVKCPCKDKAEHWYSNDCSIMGCNDDRCLHEVERKGRRERKWYM